jgi:hypothetical protein
VARSLWKDLFCYRSSVAHPAATRRRSPSHLPAIHPARRPPSPNASILKQPCWLNLVERWFAERTNRKLRRFAHRSVTALEADIRSGINSWNADPKPFIWTKTADEILENLANYCQRINEDTGRSLGLPG